MRKIITYLKYLIKSNIYLTLGICFGSSVGTITTFVILTGMGRLELNSIALLKEVICEEQVASEVPVTHVEE